MNTNAKIISASTILVLSGLLFIHPDSASSIIQFINESFHIELDLFFRLNGFYCFGLMMICSGFMLMAYSPFLKLKARQQSFLAISVLILFFIYLLIKTKHNVPVFDDYTGIFNFLCNYHDTDMMSDKMRLFFEPYFECRIPIPYLIILLFDNLPGDLMPLNLMVAMNALVLLWISMILFGSLKNKNDLIPYLPWFLLLVFNTEYMQSSFSPLSGLCYNGVLLFALLSFREYQKNSTRGKLLSVTYAACAMFTFGNGIVLVPLLLVFAFRTGRLKKSIIYILPLFILAALYFTNYHPYRPTHTHFDPFFALFFIPVFLGSALQFFYSPILPFISGLAILTLYIYASLKRYDLRNPVLYYGLGFIILTAVVSAGFRTTASYDVALKLRYGVFSSFALLLSIFMCIELFDLKNSKRLLSALSVLVLCYNLLSAQFFYPESVLTIENNKMMLRDWKKSGQFEEVSAYYPADLKPVLQCSYELGLWETGTLE